MGMYYFELFGSILIAILSVIGFLCIVIEENKFDVVAIVMLFFAVTFIFLSCFVYDCYDENVAVKADEFFLTRKDAYNCDKELYSCKLKIQNWQKDSVYWQNKIDDIIKE